jgi:hypothetical protein
MPRVSLAQERLAKLSKPFDGGVSAHRQFILIIWLNGRTKCGAPAFASASTLAHPALGHGADLYARAGATRRTPLR